MIFLARVVVGSDPTLQLEGVIPAPYKALEGAWLMFDNVNWEENSEAFASFVSAWEHEFHLDTDQFNP